LKYLIGIEKTKIGFSAYSPDLPGCVATGATRTPTETTMRDAIAFHIEGLRAERMTVRPPRSYST